jgi:hypothetical protein
MTSYPLSSEQKNVLKKAATGKIFLSGPAGCGKTTLGVEWMLNTINSGFQADQFLILVPQRSLAEPYFESIHRPDFPSATLPTILTIGGLAQRMISLFWPLIAKSAGFGNPNHPPLFLSLETAQYYMAKIVQPMLDNGDFENITIDRNRLFAQILDNLNKSALVGFSYSDFGQRMNSALPSDPLKSQIFNTAQKAATTFRQLCKKQNLLDYSLQLETFCQFIWPSTLAQAWLKNQYKGLIYDNIEEDAPIAHDLISEWLPSFDSALLIYDDDGGYRSFLGADPLSGLMLGQSCDRQLKLNISFVAPPVLEQFQQALTGIISIQEPQFQLLDISPNVEIQYARYIPEMIKLVTSQITNLVREKQVCPDEIAILSPFLSDSLRFSIQHSLSSVGIKSESFRPSRSLFDEPVTRCFLTLAKIAYPQWGLIPTAHEMRFALMQALTDGDLVRADLLSQILYRRNHPEERIGSFKRINSDMQARITYLLGEKYEHLREWLSAYILEPPEELDVFISRIFGEVLSQKGFGFHSDMEAAWVISRLEESIHKFNLLLGFSENADKKDSGKEYLLTMEQGLLPSLSSPSEMPAENAVQLMPAYSWLMKNHSVRFQFWLGIGSGGWSERINQPLTHPFILSRQWQADRIWTDADEMANNQQTLTRLVRGLLHRCTEKVFLYSIQVNEQGMEESGGLVKALQIFFKRQAQINHV